MCRLPAEFAGTARNDRLICAERIGEQTNLTPSVFKPLTLNRAPFACRLAHGVRCVGNFDERIINTVEDSRCPLLDDKPVEFREVFAVYETEAVIPIAHVDNGFSFIRRYEERFQDSTVTAVDHSGADD